MNQCLLVFIAPPSIEHALVDWLLDRKDISGFTSINANGHGGSVHSFTPAEQVAGRQNQVMFQMHLPETTAQEIIESVKNTFKGGRIHYWLMPLINYGRIDQE